MFMELQVSLDKAYKPSEDVVAREVAGEFIIIPIEQVEKDCVGLIQELLKRKILVDQENN